MIEATENPWPVGTTNHWLFEEGGPVAVEMLRSTIPAQLEAAERAARASWWCWRCHYETEGPCPGCGGAA